MEAEYDEENCRKEKNEDQEGEIKVTWKQGGKLENAKQEIARNELDILEMSEVSWGRAMK